MSDQPNTLWQPEKVDLLRRLWDEGNSIVQITAELGQFTPSAVRSKLERMRLRMPERRRVNRAPDPSSVARAAEHAPPGNGSVARSSIVTVFRIKLGGNIEGPQNVEAKDLKPEQSGEAVTIFNLVNNHCRYPIGPNERGEQQFCGKPKSRKAYCERHAEACYIDPATKRTTERIRPFFVRSVR